MRCHRRTVGGRVVTVLALVAVLAACGWLVPAAAYASACTAAWIGPPGATDLSGVWAAAANWSTGTVPTSVDDVCLSAPGSYTVTVTADTAVHSLTVGDGGNAPTLALDDHGPDPTL